MSVSIKNCPWCNHAIEAGDSPRCRKCGWTPGAKVQKKALFTYGIFLAVMLLLALGCLVWVRRTLHEVDVTRPAIPLIVPAPLTAR